MGLANITNNILVDSGILVGNLTPTSRNITINGVTYDLSADRSWTIATHDAVTIGTANGLSLSGQVLSLALASGSTTGALSSTDWTTFNNKQNALTNPVTGTGTTNYLPKFTGTSTIGNSQVFDNGTNVGIGTASPGYLLDVAGASRSDYHILRSNQSAPTADAFIFRPADNSIALGTANTERLRIDASGNLGLGVTPSNAYADSRTFEIGANGILWSEASSSIYNSLIIGLNFYYNAGGTAVYKNSSIPSSRYIQYQGSHQWSTAPSGTAGNAISFTQAMTLNASGNLSIGNTNDTYKLDVSGTGRFTSTLTVVGNAIMGPEMYRPTTDSYLRINGGGSGVDGAAILMFGSTHPTAAGRLNLGAVGSESIIFSAGGATRLTIASTGAATFSSSVSVNSSASNIVALDVSGNTGNGVRQRFLNQSSSGLYNFQIGTHISAANAFEIGASSATDGTSFNNVFKILNTGAATFSSSVTAGYYDGAIFRVLTSSTFRGGVGTGSWAFADGSNDMALTSDAATKIGAGGVERMRITSGGNVLINRSSDLATGSSTSRLVVNGAVNVGSAVGNTSFGSKDDGGLGVYVGSGANAFQVWDDNQFSYPRFIVQRAGNVGIGTTSPSSILTVLKTITTNFGAKGNAALSLGTAGSSGEANLINFGYDAESWQPAYMGYLCTSGAGSSNGALVFATRDSTTNVQPTERMRITSGGNVGIGTASPNVPLSLVGNHVSGYSTFKIQSVTSYSGGALSSLGFMDSDGSRKAIIYTNSDGLQLETSVSTPILFNTNGAERMRITSGGNLLLGTTSEYGSGFRLQINGSAYITGMVYSNTGFYINSGQYTGITEAPYTGIYMTNSSSSDGFGALLVTSRTDVARPIIFGTSNGSTSVERMRITSGGNVGIGTTSPAYKLEVNNSSGDSHIAAVGTAPSLQLMSANTGPANWATIGMATSTNHFITGAAAGDFCIANRGTTAGNMLFGFSSSEKMRLTSNGDLLVNATATTQGAKFYVNGIGAFGSVYVASLGTGTVYSNGGTLTNTNPSDYRLKNTIKPLTYGLNEVLQLNPKTFYYNDDATRARLKYGFIAQEVKEVMPDMVRLLGNEDYLGLEQEGIWVTLVNAIKEQQAQIEQLKSQLNK